LASEKAVKEPKKAIVEAKLNILISCLEFAGILLTFDPGYGTKSIAG